MEQRSSVQPRQSEELQIDLERSLVEELELECGVLRARQIICDIQRKGKGSDMSDLGPKGTGLCIALVCPSGSEQTPLEVKM